MTEANDPAAVRKYKIDNAAFKFGALAVAYVFLFLGLAAAVGGLFAALPYRSS